mgnify:FL=1
MQGCLYPIQIATTFLPWVIFIGIQLTFNSEDIDKSGVPYISTLLHSTRDSGTIVFSWLHSLSALWIASVWLSTYLRYRLLGPVARGRWTTIAVMLGYCLSWCLCMLSATTNRYHTESSGLFLFVGWLENYEISLRRAFPVNERKRLFSSLIIAGTIGVYCLFFVLFSCNDCSLEYAFLPCWEWILVIGHVSIDAFTRPSLDGGRYCFRGDGGEVVYGAEDEKEDLVRAQTVSRNIV